MQKAQSHKEIEIGGLTKAGSSRAFKTGDWRSMRPVWDEKRCIHCMFCVVYCPENCIPTKDGKRAGEDMDYCKGCMICEQVCPVKCISHKEESEFKAKKEK